MSPLGKISTPPDAANVTNQIYDRITVRLAGRRLSYLVYIESEDMMAVRGIEVDRLDQEIGPIILGKSSIVKRTPMELNDGYLRPVRNPCGRCRLSVPFRWLCIFCERMMCDRCLATSRRCIDCHLSRKGEVDG